MTPPSRGYPVPFVQHSTGSNRTLSASPSPTIVVDVPRLVEHMKTDIRTMLQDFKLELVAAFRKELADQAKQMPNVVVPENLLEVVKHALVSGAVFQGKGSEKSEIPDETETTTPLFVPSDLLAPRDGSVSVKTESQGMGSLDEATAKLRRAKKGQT